MSDKKMDCNAPKHGVCVLVALPHQPLMAPTMELTTMKKKHLIAMLTSLLIASSTFACAEDSSKEQVAKTTVIIDTIYDKLDKGEDCKALAADLDDYCKGVYTDILDIMAEFKDAKTEAEMKALLPKFMEIQMQLNRIEEFETYKCVEDDDVWDAISICGDAFESDDDWEEEY